MGKWVLEYMADECSKSGTILRSVTDSSYPKNLVIFFLWANLFILVWIID